MSSKTHICFNRLLIHCGMSLSFFSPLGVGGGTSRKKKCHGYFIKHGATPHTVNYSINVLNKVSKDRR
jgi:hypothetical protein